MPNAKSWNVLFDSPLAEAAPEIASKVKAQEVLNADAVNLVASECHAPRAALEAQGSALVNKNATGYPGARVLGDCGVVDAIERLAVERVKAMFEAEHANVQALSSTVGNVAILRALLKPSDRILSFDRTAGGHMSHGWSGHASGQDYEARNFGIDEATGRIDLDELRRVAKAFRPHIIMAGASNYPRQIDFAGLAEVAQGAGAMLFADIAHVSGLIVAGLHPNPVPLCDAASTSTHKTLCGPRTGGFLMCKAKYAEALDAALAPGLQDAPGAHIIAGRAALLDIVSRPAFRDLMGATVAHAGVLAAVLRERGIALYTGGTETHMVVVDLRRSDWAGPDLVHRLERHRLIANATRLASLPGGIGNHALRLGALAMTIRGVDEEGFRTIGGLIADVVEKGPGAPEDAGLRQSVSDLAGRHPIPYQ